MSMETFHYDNKIVRNFGIATIAFGVIGFIVGLIIALKLFLPDFWDLSQSCLTVVCVHCTQTL